MNIPLIVLIIVFILISVRQIGNVKLKIWQIMLFGAISVILTGNISFEKAIKSIDIDVILFLFGMFVTGQALEVSGYLSHLTYKIFKKIKSLDHLILAILFVMGFASAILMNDTLAIIGTPVVLTLAKNHKMHPKVLLLALAFSITTGSVLSPIGNPQNLLIAINGRIHNPFFVFLKYLAITTIINIFIIFLMLKIYYKSHFHKEVLKHSQEPIRDKKLAILSKISLNMIIILIIVKMFFIILNLKFDFRLTYIALISALPVIIFSNKRLEVIKKIDWGTLIFFAAMFVLMKSVWDTGFFQGFINGYKVTSISFILSSSIVLSQFISNVPLVALFLPVLNHSGAGLKELMALAAGSTIAGNMLILSAASNVIIIQNAEKKGEHSLNFIRFAKIGMPVTILNSLVYWAYFRIFIK